MTDAIQFFSNESFGTIRVAGTSEKPLFCLADLCSAIGVVNHRNVKARLEESDVRLLDTPTYNQYGVKVVQPITFVTESGMYDVIIRSDSESAKPFRRWLTNEVLPSIRKTGSYSTASKPKREPTLTTKVRVSLEWVKGVSDILNLNDSSKLSMLKMVAEPLGLPTPDYTKSKGILKSASELLKANNSKLSCQEFNKIMIDKGFIKVMTRESSKGEKKFKSITGDGLNYGENQVNPNNPKETQPLYYEEKFNKLLKLLAAN
jgi:prophage antirepressor-like protein